MALVAPFAPALLTGCDGGKTGESGVEPTGVKEDFTIEVGDTPLYSLTEIKVKSGSTVTVTVKHTGKMPLEQMGHNFVLLKQNVDMAVFAAKASTATGTSYIPESEKDSIIAHTNLVGAQQSDSVSFTAPVPGTYTYLCTFPGHSAGMNGKLIVS